MQRKSVGLPAAAGHEAPSSLLIQLPCGGDLPAAQALAMSAGVPFDPDAELTKPYSQFWLARFGPEAPIAGFLVSWDVVGEQQLIHLATASWARRKGVARALMRRLMQHARSRSAARIVLEVRASNAAAVSLYRAFGFVVDGVRTAYYKDPAEDALQMRINL